MCTPAAIAALGASGLGALASMKGASDQQAARASAIRNENNRQRSILDRSRAVFDQTLPTTGADARATAQTDAAAARTATDTGILSAGQYAPNVSGSAPAEVKSSVARAMRNALAAGQDRARRGAAVGAYSDVNQGIGTGLTHANQWQSIFGNEALRSSNILPLELEDANRAGGLWRGIGSLLSAGGQAVGAAGASGGLTWSDLNPWSVANTAPGAGLAAAYAK